jgi:Holliday junction resolvase-like predicted endonuclease
MKNDDPLEKVIEKKVCDYAKSKGFVVYKFASFNNAGVPDRIMITKKGTVLFVEFKRKGRKLTPLQAIHRDKIQGNTGIYFLVDDIEYGKSIVDMWS